VYYRQDKTENLPAIRKVPSLVKAFQSFWKFWRQNSSVYYTA